jgi:hypothetical protein
MHDVFQSLRLGRLSPMFLAQEQVFSAAEWIRDGGLMKGGLRNFWCFSGIFLSHVLLS